MMASGPEPLFSGDQKKIQSYFKHRFLTRYAPQFAFKLGARGDRIAVVDGFAGIPYYKDGEPGSGPILLDIASKHPNMDVCLMELKKKYADELEAAASDYAPRADGRTWARVVRGDTRANLRGVVRSYSYADAHLLLYLDPCGYGIAFDDLVAAIRSRDGNGKSTEVMLNFGSGLIERIGGGYFKGTNSGERLTAACGGTWWVDVARPLVEADEGKWGNALGAVISEFARRLRDATNSHVVAVPIRSSPRARPMFFMVCATPSSAGVFALSDAYARAWDDWKNEAAKRASIGTIFETTRDLFVDPAATRDVAAARGTLREDVLSFVAAGRRGKVGYQPDLLRRVVGRLTDAEVGQELRAMADAGLIGLEKGRRPADYLIHAA